MALTAGTYEAKNNEYFADGGNVISYTVADATTISKGTLCILSGTKTATRGVTGYVGVNQPAAGIAVADKVAADGSTTLGLATTGIFTLRVDDNAVINKGDMVTISGSNNQIAKAVEADVVSGAVLGKALQDGGVSEEILVRLMV